MKKILFTTALSLTVVLFFGCSSPELERTPYGQDELRWEGFIKSNYTGWNSPQSVPPSAMNEPLSSADIPALPPLPEFDSGVMAPLPAQPSEQPKGAAESYTVSKGDTLWSISKKFYGQGGKWQIILDANRDRIPDPNKLKAGTVITIPPKP